MTGQQPPRKPVDLSSGFYDLLEFRLSQLLGLKVLLIRGWEAPQLGGYGYDGHGNETFGDTDDQQTRELTSAFFAWNRAVTAHDDGEGPDPGPDPLREAMRESLLAYLLKRDAELAANIYDEELGSLLDCGHIVMRQSAALPPEGVILFDLRHRIRDREALFEDLFGATFRNAWSCPQDKAAGRDIPMVNFINGFDIELEDYRTWKALHDIRYALRHQNDYDQNERDGDSDPFLYRFADLTGDGQGIFRTAASVPYEEVVDRYSFIPLLKNSETGIVRPDLFIWNMTMACALREFLQIPQPPRETFALLQHSLHAKAFPPLTEQKVAAYGRQLHDALRAAIERRLPAAAAAPDADSALRDPRILAPLLYEVMKKIPFDEAGKVYLRTLWRAVYRYMPDLASGDVPILAPGYEPPRSIAGYRRNNNAPYPRP